MRYTSNSITRGRYRGKDWVSKTTIAWLRRNGIKTQRDLRRARMWRLSTLAVLLAFLSFSCGVGVASAVAASHQGVAMAHQWHRLMTLQPPLP